MSILLIRAMALLTKRHRGLMHDGGWGIKPSRSGGAAFGSQLRIVGSDRVEFGDAAGVQLAGVATARSDCAVARKGGPGATAGRGGAQEVLTTPDQGPSSEGDERAMLSVSARDLSALHPHAIGRGSGARTPADRPRQLRHQRQQVA